MATARNPCTSGRNFRSPGGVPASSPLAVERSRVTDFTWGALRHKAAKPLLVVHQDSLTPAEYSPAAEQVSVASYPCAGLTSICLAPFGGLGCRTGPRRLLEGDGSTEGGRPRVACRVGPYGAGLPVRLQSARIRPTSA